MCQNQDADALSRLHSIDKEVLFNDVIKAICQGVLASKENIPSVEYVLLAQNASIENDEIGKDFGCSLSQVEWVAEQTVDAPINRVRQLLLAGHKPTKRQISLEPSDCQKRLREWDHFFFKDSILYRRYNARSSILS